MKKNAVVSCLAFVILYILQAGQAFGCACGCNVFDVGTSAMLPTHEGGLAYLEYNISNQNQNWSGRRPASNDDNGDKRIFTNFVTFGAQYMFNRSWGVMTEIPYWDRRFKTTDDSGAIANFHHASVGDIRIRGVYSGFSEDMSSGLTFGLKLPSGDFNAPNFDRDTQIGTGSTDLLFGAYRMGAVAALRDWNWFSSALMDQPVLMAGGYRPGGELDFLAGTCYDRWRVAGVKVAPTAQIIGSHRWRDSGMFGHAPGSGYDRLLLGPGLELAAAGMRVYADVGFPVYQRVNGNQLMPAQYYKFSVGYAF